MAKSEKTPFPQSKKLKKKLPKDPNLRLACELTISSDLKIHTL